MADTTQTSTSTNTPEPAHPWRLSLVHHDNPTCIGRAIELVERPTVLGRESTLYGPGALRGPHLSRTHAELAVVDGRPFVRDLDSHNGTFVNGQRIERQRLEAGDVLGVGHLLLLVTREPGPPEVTVPDGLVARSHGFSVALAATYRAARRGPTLLWGHSGTGKSSLARVLHDNSGRAGSLHHVQCGNDSCEAATQLPAWIGTAADTVVLDNVEELTAKQQLLVLGALSQPHDDRAAIAACTVLSPDALRSRLRPQLADRLLRWSIRVPPLTERRADIMPLALHFARRFGDSSDVRLSAELAYRLLRHRWPGNLHELEAVIERATVDARGTMLAVFDGLDTIFTHAVASIEISRGGQDESAAPFVVDAAGAWYTTPDGTRHNLERRKTLTRVLATLVETLERSPGRPLSVAELLERAWPGEALLPRAGANRVYVAMTSLRRMGLRDVLVRADAGYLLDPDVPLRVAR